MNIVMLNPFSLLFGVISLPFLLMFLALKGWALWQAAINKQTNWFIAILLLNTLGILELVYLFFYAKENRYSDWVKTKFSTTWKKESQGKVQDIAPKKK